MSLYFFAGVIGTLEDILGATDQAPTIASTPAPAFTEGVADTYDMKQHVNDDARSTVTYAISGALPSGVTFDTGTGILSYDGIGADVTSAGHQLTATDAVGAAQSSAFSVVVTNVETVPAAPSNAAAAALSTSIIELTWTDNANNEANFSVERATAGAGGPFTEIATPAANATSYQDTGLDPSTQYWYRVRAQNAAGDSAYTSVVTATTDAVLTVPTAPSNLVATAQSHQAVNLSWADNSDNETGFRIERAVTAVGTYSEIATAGAGVTTYADSGLAAETQYSYRVRAYNGAGNSSYSNVDSATTSAAPAGTSVLWASDPDVASPYNYDGLLDGTRNGGYGDGTVTVSTVTDTDYGGNLLALTHVDNGQFDFGPYLLPTEGSGKADAIWDAIGATGDFYVRYLIKFVGTGFFGDFINHGFGYEYKWLDVGDNGTSRLIIKLRQPSQNPPEADHCGLNIRVDGPSSQVEFQSWQAPYETDPFTVDTLYWFQVGFLENGQLKFWVAPYTGVGDEYTEGSPTFATATGWHSWSAGDISQAERGFTQFINHGNDFAKTVRFHMAIDNAFIPPGPVVSQN